MLPESPVAAVSFLKLVRVLQSLCVIGLVLLRLSARERIDLLQIADGEGSFPGILALKRLVKIRQLRIAVLQLRDDQSHLKAPVTEMNVTDCLIAVITDNSLDRFSDDRGTEMSHVKGLRHIRSAVVQNDRLRLLRERHSEFDRFGHFLQISPQPGFLHIQIDETGLYHGNILENIRILKLCRHILRNHERGLVVLPGAGHCPVALILGKIRAGGNSHLAHRSVIPCRRKCLSHLLCQCFQQLFHSFSFSFPVLSHAGAHAGFLRFAVKCQTAFSPGP